MFGQMESWDPIEQCIIVRMSSDVSSASFPVHIFENSRGLALLYFCWCFNFCVSHSEGRPMSHKSSTVNMEVPVIVDMHTYNALVSIYS